MKYRRKRKKQRFSNKKRLTILFVSLLTALVAFAVIMGIGGLFSVQNGYEDLTEEIVEPVDKETGKINILVIGLDYDKTRTDTIMVASYDLDNNQVNVLSIPRDTRMYVGGRYQKINCAYAISKNGKMNGVNGTIEAVTRLTGIPINYYAELSFDAFRKTIDALGGVDYEVPQNMNYDDPYQNLHIHLTKGYQHLDGDKAEQLVRFRKYPMGDIDRVKVQQSFIKAFAEQKLNITIISKIPDLFKVLQDEVKTNFTASDVAKYCLNLMDLSSENIHAFSLPGTADSQSYGASYWIPDMTETKLLIENTFGYEADNITIHSADGKSISKDVKKTGTSSDINTADKAKETNKAQTEKAKQNNTSKTKSETYKEAEKPSSKTENKVSSNGDAAEKTEAESSRKQTETKAQEEKQKTEVKEKKDSKNNTIKRPSANPTEDE